MSTKKKEIDDVHNSELYLYFYENSLKAERTIRECDFVEKHCGSADRKKLLDLACGHGRHSIEFAKRGYGVTGVDMNSDFIKMAKKASSEIDENIHFIEGDLLEVNFKEVFDTVVLLFNTLGFFDRNNVKKIFKIIDQSLQVGGRAIVDCKNRDHIIKEIGNYEVFEKGQDLMVDKITFNPKDGTTTNARIYIKDGKRFEASFKMYCYNYTDLVHLLEGTSLQIKQVLGGWKEEVFDSNSRRIILILEKEG